MQWFQKFMMGRYGADPLNLAIILLSLVISIAFSFTLVAWIGSILCTILLIPGPSSACFRGTRPSVRRKIVSL